MTRPGPEGGLVGDHDADVPQVRSERGSRRPPGNGVLVALLFCLGLVLAASVALVIVGEATDRASYRETTALIGPAVLFALVWPALPICALVFLRRLGVADGGRMNVRVWLGSLVVICAGMLATHLVARGARDVEWRLMWGNRVAVMVWAFFAVSSVLVVTLMAKALRALSQRSRPEPSDVRLLRRTAVTQAVAFIACDVSYCFMLLLLIGYATSGSD